MGPPPRLSIRAPEYDEDEFELAKDYEPVRTPEDDGQTLAERVAAAIERGRAAAAGDPSPSAKHKKQGSVSFHHTAGIALYEKQGSDDDSGSEASDDDGTAAAATPAAEGQIHTRYEVALHAVGKTLRANLTPEPDPAAGNLVRAAGLGMAAAPLSGPLPELAGIFSLTVDEEEKSPATTAAGVFIGRRPRSEAICEYPEEIEEDAPRLRVTPARTYAALLTFLASHPRRIYDTMQPLAQDYSKRFDADSALLFLRARISLAALSKANTEARAALAASNN